MIANQNQYKAARAQARRCRQEILDLEAGPKARPAAVAHSIQSKCEALESVLAGLQGELDAYDHLKSRGPVVIKVESIHDLGDGLIRARIASGLSQQGLAERMNLKKQQIQRYESSRYQSASYRRMCEVADALGRRTEPGVVCPIVFAEHED